jgi:hypothetical protein
VKACILNSNHLERLSFSLRGLSFSCIVNLVCIKDVGRHNCGGFRANYEKVACEFRETVQLSNTFIFNV